MGVAKQASWNQPTNPPFLNPLKPSFTIDKVPGQGMDECFSTLIMPCLGEQCGSSGGGKQSDGDGKPRSGHKE